MDKWHWEVSKGTKIVWKNKTKHHCTVKGISNGRREDCFNPKFIKYCKHVRLIPSWDTTSKNSSCITQIKWSHSISTNEQKICIRLWEGCQISLLWWILTSFVSHKDSSYNFSKHFEKKKIAFDRWQWNGSCQENNAQVGSTQPACCWLWTLPHPTAVIKNTPT